MKNCPKCTKFIKLVDVEDLGEKKRMHYQCLYCGFATTRTSRPVLKLATPADSSIQATGSDAVSGPTDADRLSGLVESAWLLAKSYRDALEGWQRDLADMGWGPSVVETARVLSRVQNEAASHCVEFQNLALGAKTP